MFTIQKELWAHLLKFTPTNKERNIPTGSLKILILVASKEHSNNIGRTLDLSVSHYDSKKKSTVKKRLSSPWGNDKVDFPVKMRVTVQGGSDSVRLS